MRMVPEATKHCRLLGLPARSDEHAQKHARSLLEWRELRSHLEHVPENVSIYPSGASGACASEQILLHYIDTHNLARYTSHRLERPSPRTLDKLHHRRHHHSWLNTSRPFWLALRYWRFFCWGRELGSDLLEALRDRLSYSFLAL